MRFIWGHVLIHLLSLAYESLDGLHIYLAPVTTALLGFFWQGIFSSHTFTPALWHGWHLTTVFFYKVHITTPCIFSSAGFSSVSYLESLLRALLRSWGSFGCPMSPTLLEGVTKLPVDFPQLFTSNLACVYCLISSGVSSIVSGVWPFDRLSGGASVGSCL